MERISSTRRPASLVTATICLLRVTGRISSKSDLARSQSGGGSVLTAWYSHLKFDSGWIETNFFLYSDNKCENQIFKGYIGNYDVSIRGMVVGSIRAD